MSRDRLLDFYREIVNSEKSFGIDYKNLSKELIERIDKAIEYIKGKQELNKMFGNIVLSKESQKELLEILGDKE